LNIIHLDTSEDFGRSVPANTICRSAGSPPLNDITKESIIGKTYVSGNLPPAFVPQGGTSRRQVTPLACLYGREKIAKEG
jgi:hypothetical protein